MDLMSCSFVNYVTLLVSIERKHHTCDIIVLDKLTLTQSKCISDISNYMYTSNYLKIRECPKVKPHG